MKDQIREKQSKYGSRIQNALFPEQAPEIRSLLGTLDQITTKNYGLTNTPFQQPI